MGILSGKGGGVGILSRGGVSCPRGCGCPVWGDGGVGVLSRGVGVLSRGDVLSGGAEVMSTHQ